MENYDKELEKRLIEMIKEKEKADKRLLRLEWVIGVLSVIIIVAPTIIAAYVPMKEWQRIIVAFSGFIPAFIGIAYAIKIEQVAGYYKCAKCGHCYVPTMKAVMWSMHMGRTRYMKCPKCNQKSWQKKVISKEE